MKLPRLKMPKGSGPRRWAFLGSAMATSTTMTLGIELWAYILPLTCLLGLAWVIKGD